MNVNDILMNFHSMLASCLPFLMRAGVTVGDDEWDELVETAFAVTVSFPLEVQHRLSLDWKYGTWPSSVSTAAQVYAAVDPSTETILVGQPERAGDGSITVRYSERSLAASLRIAFREFANPIMEEDAVERINYVLGEVVNEGQPLPPGTRVCVPLTACSFDVA